MFSLTVSRDMPLAAATVYRVWTTEWHAWFAEPDTIRMTAEVGAPFFFEVGQRFEDGRPMKRHPHYGRFLSLTPQSEVALTWVTGASGTEGAETTVTVQFAEYDGGTRVTLTHAGFLSEGARDRHAHAWPMVLEQQEAKLTAAIRASGEDASHSAGGFRANRSIPAATLIPVRSYPELDSAVAWLRDALGCRERLRIPGHRVQMTIGNGAFVAAAWDASAAPVAGGRPPATLMLRVTDLDATFARAIALGATALSEPSDQAYGERQAQLRDPAGHAWTLTQTIADVDPAEWGGELMPASSM